MHGKPPAPQPQPEPRARVKRRKHRHAAKVVKSVRALCVERDGSCRFGEWEDNPYDCHDDEMEGDVCAGRSEWAHLWERKRFKTRGQPPETRHTTAGSLMLCHAHHAAYDRGWLGIVALSERGADGRLAFAGHRYRRAR